MAVRDIRGESPWGPGATGNAAWRGAALADVLDVAGVRPEATHVALAGADVAPEADPRRRRRARRGGGQRDVLEPADGDRVRAGAVEVRGYAFADGERHVVRVDVSGDRARSFTPPSCWMTSGARRGGCGARG